MTSQSADMHIILFHRIFSIAEQDTGIPVRFFHIHGMRIKSIIADEHCGQALGICFLHLVSRSNSLKDWGNFV